MNPVYLIVGVPGSGKSWVCYQLQDLFEYVLHDEYMEGGYVRAILERLETSKRAILAEAPFSISQIKDSLEDAGVTVIPVFILEDEEVLRERYREREGREIPKGHLTRQNTYRARAAQYDAFSGTSDEVLGYLRSECGHHTESLSK